jgi:hypothetical protein
VQHKAIAKRSNPPAYPYESLFTFANEEINQENWKKVLDRLRHFSLPPTKKGKNQDRAMLEWSKIYYRRGAEAPVSLRGETIAGGEPLLSIQRELREILERLTDPSKDLKPLIKEGFCKDFSWLRDNIKRSLEEEAFRMRFDTFRRNPRKESLFHALATDIVSLSPAITDLRTWVYFQLANLWLDEFLLRIGRCQNLKCQHFFLAKTERENRRYCSQRCAQAVSAPERVKASRERRATWEKRKASLRQLLTDTDAFARKQKLQRPRSERQILEEGEKVLRVAETAFAAAYPRQKGAGYKEGKALLARANEQVKRLRKQVKGY